MRYRWKVIVRGEGQSWEHLNLAEDQAAMIVESCPSDYFAYMLPMCMFDEWRNKKWVN